MEHDFSLISTIAFGFGMALILGFIAERLRTPALVGYLLAGIIIGPKVAGLGDIKIAEQLSELGVMLLMFGVGLHLSLGDLLAVKRIAIPGAVAQMGFATILGMLFGELWGWGNGEAFVFGLSLSCASTVVLIKALETRGILDTMNGRIAVGWLVVEDLATVLALVLMPPLAKLYIGGGGGGADANAVSLLMKLGETLLYVAAFIALMLVAGRRVIPWMLWQVARTGSRELFTLAVIAVAIGIAYAAQMLFSVSFALGAFFAGMVMRESKLSHRAADESLPFRDAFSVLFFVSVGMLFEPMVLVDAPFKTLVVVGIIILGKSLIATLLVLLFRYPMNTALTVSASLAQIGEFSFILAAMSVSVELMSEEGRSLILAGALISIALNPLVFMTVNPLRRWLLVNFEFARNLERREEPFAQLPMSTDRKYLEGQVVLVGYGRVGQRIATALEERNVPYVVAEQNRESVEDLRKQGKAAVYGDATDPSVLIQAHIVNAAILVVATSSPVDVRQMAEASRTLNPGIEIVVRSHNDEESRLLRGEGIGVIFNNEEELAKNMSNYVVERFRPVGQGGHHA